MGREAIIFWSGSGNTEAMAKAIQAGMGAQTDLHPVLAAPSDLSVYDKIAFGCPAMGAEVLEESEFDPYFTSIESQLSGKKVALFGSYGWGDGEWMRNWVTRVRSAGATLFDEGLIVQDSPDTAVCTEYGQKFASF